jgi:hypothetical protein
MQSTASHAPPHASAKLATFVVFVLGTASWLALAAVIREREVWDSSIYFVVVLPLSIAIGGFTGRRFGGPSVRWPLAFFGGEFAMVVIGWLLRGGASLWPLTLGWLGLLSLPCWFAASIAVRARNATRGSTFVAPPHKSR